LITLKFIEKLSVDNLDKLTYINNRLAKKPDIVSGLFQVFNRPGMLPGTVEVLFVVKAVYFIHDPVASPAQNFMEKYYGKWEFNFGNRSIRKTVQVLGLSMGPQAQSRGWGLYGAQE